MDRINQIGAGRGLLKLARDAGLGIHCYKTEIELIRGEVKGKRLEPATVGRHIEYILTQSEFCRSSGEPEARGFSSKERLSKMIK